MKNISIWKDTVNNSDMYDALNENIDVDILIIGGGITGCSTFYQFKDDNRKIALVENGVLTEYYEENEESLQRIRIIGKHGYVLALHGSHLYAQNFCSLRAFLHDKLYNPPAPVIPGNEAKVLTH